MKIKNLKRGLALIGLIGSAILGSYVTATKTNLLDKRPIPLVLELNGTEVNTEIPRYNLLKIRPGNCARYARKVAMDVFGLEYNPANAWNLRYSNKIVGQTNNEQLEELVTHGDLKPGMLIGIYNPKSAHVNDIDQTGEKVKYTHVVIYLGKNEGELIFAHQFQTKFEVFKQKDLSLRGLEAREIIAPEGYFEQKRLSYKPK